MKESMSAVRDFCEAREWDQFHDPTNLAIGISTEAAELLAHFRFKSKEEALALLQSPKKREEIELELADIQFFILRFAQLYSIDLDEAIRRKLAINEQRLPVEKSKGSNKKYNEL